MGFQGRNCWVRVGVAPGTSCLPPAPLPALSGSWSPQVGQVLAGIPGQVGLSAEPEAPPPPPSQPCTLLHVQLSCSSLTTLWTLPSDL